MNYYGQPGGQNGGPPPPQLYYPYGDYASPDEKKKIRRNFNTIGIVLLALYILTAAVCMTAYIFFAPDIVYNEYGQAVYGLADMIIGGNGHNSFCSLLRRNRLQPRRAFPDGKPERQTDRQICNDDTVFPAGLNDMHDNHVQRTLFAWP